MNCSVSVGVAVSALAAVKLAPSDRRWIDAATLHFKYKLLERLAVPKKLLACNTKLKLKIT